MVVQTTASYRAHLIQSRAMAAPWRGGHRRTPGATVATLLLLVAAVVGPSRHASRMASAQDQPHLMSMYPDKGATVGGTTVTIKGGPFTRTLNSKVRFSDLNGEVDEVCLFPGTVKGTALMSRPTSPRRN